MPICTSQTHRELRGLRSTQKSSGAAAYFMITFLGEAQLSVPLRKKNERDRVRKRKVKCMCVCSSEVLADDCHNSWGQTDRVAQCTVTSQGDFHFACNSPFQTQTRLCKLSHISSSKFLITSSLCLYTFPLLFPSHVYLLCTFAFLLIPASLSSFRLFTRISSANFCHLSVLAFSTTFTQPFINVYNIYK